MSTIQNQWIRRFVLVSAFALLFASVALIAPPDALADNPNPGILPPNSNAFGQSYGEWSADWWTWQIENGAAPLYDATGEYCDVGQSGKVWFLSGSAVGPVERDCTIPAGKAIFFPIQNVVWLSAPDDPYVGYPDYPEPGGIDVVRAGLAADNDASGGRSATIDGVAVEDLDDYRVASAVFGAQWPGWYYLSPNVDEGWYLMLAPLSRGEHTIEFTGWDGGQDIKYNLTVGKPK